jgi:polysaccharide biosynthesis protein PslL
MNHRNDGLDIAKGLGIILVVLGHNWIVLGSMGELFRVIYSFHMPLFFVLSGVFLKESERFGELLRAKSASLLKPYVVVLLGLGAARWLAASVESPFDPAQYLLGVAWGTGSTLQWVPLWFLPNLFVAVACAHLVMAAHRQLAHRQAWLFVTACALLLVGSATIDAFWRPAPEHPTPLGSGYLPGLPWSIDLAPISTAFVLLGHVFRERLRSGVNSVPWFATALVAFISLHVLRDDTINLNMRVYGQAIVSSIQAAAGIYITLFIATQLQTAGGLKRALCHLGKASLFILIFHRFFQDKVFTVLSAATGDPCLASAASLVAGVLGPLLIWELAARQRAVAALLLPRRSSRSEA